MEKLDINQCRALVYRDHQFEKSQCMKPGSLAHNDLCGTHWRQFTKWEEEGRAKIMANFYWDWDRE